MAQQNEVPRVHGVEYPMRDFQRGGRLHFALHKLLGKIAYDYYWPRGSDDPPPKLWPKLWVDRVFALASGKVDDLVMKLVVLNSCYAEGELKVREAAFASKVSGTPFAILLDSLISYLQMLADCLADVTPHFYGARGRHIRRRSFREQRAWFWSPYHASFDPEYTKLLRDNAHWFDVLAGKEGALALRDRIFHRHGVISLMYRLGNEEESSPVQALLSDVTGHVCNDVVTELKRVFDEMFVFLDEYVDHFNRIIEHQIEATVVNLHNPYGTELFRFESGPNFGSSAESVGGFLRHGSGVRRQRACETRELLGGIAAGTPNGAAPALPAIWPPKSQGLASSPEPRNRAANKVFRRPEGPFFTHEFC